jgi:NDP-sugar pyrophosphorylase family protein
MQAVILAGGKGTRLRPYTTILPKPLMPIQDMPILELVLRQLKENGFDDIIMAVGYLAELLEAYFGDGSKLGVRIRYSRETFPMGTIGPLTLIDGLEENFLAMNGDILTNLKYKNLMDFHLQQQATFSIAMYDKDVKIDLGTLKANENHEIYEYVEKPTLTYQVSMGIYILNRKALDYIPRDAYFDIPSLVHRLIQEKIRVSGFRFRDYWRDIGRKEDYELALDEYEALKSQLLSSSI